MNQLPLARALELVPDGATLGIGGVLLKRKPMRFLAALVEAGRADLVAVTFLGSLDVEMLATAGALAEVRSGYVGFEHLGFAPAFSQAVEAGTVRYVEYSELLFVSGLRAAAAGLPFLPSLGGMGSALPGELGLVEITDPYTGAPVLAVPALAPDVSVIHAEVADRHGNVGQAVSVDFLSDFDLILARASKALIVTVERLVDTLEGPAALFAHEVTAVVEVPGGARPTGVPGAYPADLAPIRRYLAAPSASALLGAIR